jgi:cytochrome c-type biogenesis protein CcmH/NrfF
MSRENLLILIGVLVTLSPFAGLPLTWLAWILPILGILVVIIGVTFYRSRRESEIPATS